jgi:molybdopterin molybdotransferase
VLVHGINLRPGKPTILAVCDGKPVVGLPGNPVSALVVAHLFLKPLVEALLGIKIDHSEAVVTARLVINLPSQAGREDWVGVRLERSPIDIEPPYRATPVFGKSNLIFTLVRADGMLRIAPEVTGLSAGELVDVVLW